MQLNTKKKIKYITFKLISFVAQNENIWCERSNTFIVTVQRNVGIIQSFIQIFNSSSKIF